MPFSSTKPLIFSWNSVSFWFSGVKILYFVSSGQICKLFLFLCSEKFHIIIFLEVKFLSSPVKRRFNSDIITEVQSNVDLQISFLLSAT